MWELNQTITEAAARRSGSHECALVTAAMARSISKVALLRSSPCWSASAIERPSPGLSSLPVLGFAGVDSLELDKLFGYQNKTQTALLPQQILRRHGDGEPACGLEWRIVIPVRGTGDPNRKPGCCAARGKNIHASTPSRFQPATAIAAAKVWGIA